MSKIFINHIKVQCQACHAVLPGKTDFCPFCGTEHAEPQKANPSSVLPKSGHAEAALTETQSPVEAVSQHKGTVHEPVLATEDGPNIEQAVLQFTQSPEEAPPPFKTPATPKSGDTVPVSHVLGFIAVVAGLIFGGWIVITKHKPSTGATTPLEPEMLLIKAGTFHMGSPETELGRGNDEFPHPVKIADFYLSKYEVTFDEYDRFAADTGRPKPKDDGFGRGRNAVFRMSWGDAYDYAQWLSAKTGKSYRLPTEAEWEYAARAGSDTAYFWGNDAAPLCRYANHTDCPNAPKNKNAVGQFMPNPWGLFDMIGNVEELAGSVYESGYHGREQEQAQPDSENRWRVRRGGSWAFAAPGYLRSAWRGSLDIHVKQNYIGFRLARDP